MSSFLVVGRSSQVKSNPDDIVVRHSADSVQDLSRSTAMVVWLQCLQRSRICRAVESTWE
jgi:hypothetical protein